MKIKRRRRNFPHQNKETNRKSGISFSWRENTVRKLTVDAAKRNLH